MTWNTVLEIIASIGGGGAIILGLSSYIGKLWAERLLQKKSQEFEKELESYKSNLSLEVEKYKIKAERFSLISRVQFETEYNTYKLIFDTLFDFAAYASNLFPHRIDYIPEDINERKEVYKERYENYLNSFNTYSQALETNAPFIPKEIYDKFALIRTKAHEIACMFPEIRIEADDRFADDYAKIAHDNFIKSGEFDTLVSQLKDEVRIYLATLKVAD